MAPVQRAYMQLCPWSMPTAACRVRRAGELRTFDIILINPSQIRQDWVSSKYMTHIMFGLFVDSIRATCHSKQSTGRGMLQQAIHALKAPVMTWCVP